MAKKPKSSAYQNVLLQKLSPSVLAQLSPERVELPLHEVLYEANEKIKYAYFPEAGVISVTAAMKDRSTIENGLIGREGMLGSVLLLKVQSTPYQCCVQVAGHGYRVSGRVLIKAARASQSLRDVILRYESGFRVQTMQRIACIGLHDVRSRCCRWLLMTRDRVDSDDLQLTQEFLSVLLGVRRASVNEVLAPLQDIGVVASHRGVITILNRKALEERVCECYWIIAQHERAASNLNDDEP